MQACIKPKKSRKAGFNGKAARTAGVDPVFVADPWSQPLAKIYTHRTSEAGGLWKEKPAWFAEDEGPASPSKKLFEDEGPQSPSKIAFEDEGPASASKKFLKDEEPEGLSEMLVEDKGPASPSKKLFEDEEPESPENMTDDGAGQVPLCCEAPLRHSRPFHSP